MNKKGFTMVELLAVITILGIIMVFAIPNVSKLIDRSKEDNTESNKKTLLMAGKSYMQANKSKMPKAVGEVTEVTIKELKQSGFLKEDLYNGKKESCMQNSTVSVYKVDTNKYNYTANLYCGSEGPGGTTSSAPNINITIKAISAETHKETIEIKYTAVNGVNLASYSYIISIKYDDDSSYKEIVNSGFVNLNGATSKDINEDITQYLDLTRQYSIKVLAISYNVEGGKTEEYAFSGFEDKNGPTCDTSATVGEAEEGVWSNEPREITVKCVDTNGSGCKRETYTKIFRDDTGLENGYGKIIMEDNAGRIGQCKVRVNIDGTPPTVPSVKLLKWKNNNTKPTSSKGLTEEYTSGEWSTLKVYTEPYGSTDKSGSKITYQYTTTGATTNEKNKAANYRNIEADGKSHIKWRACDVSGNCSKYSTVADINIFTIPQDQLVRPTYKLYKWDGEGDPVAAINAGNLEEYKPNTWTNTNVVVYFTHPDREKYDISFHYYKSGDQTSKDVADDYLVIDEEGVTEWQFWAKYAEQVDTYRNYDYVKVKIDRTPPTFKVTLKKDGTNLASTTSTDYEYPGEVNDSVTLLLSNVSDNGGSGVNKSYDFSYNAPFLTEFSTDIASTEVRTLNSNNSNSRDITSYGKRVLWINLTDALGNEVEVRIKVNIKNTVIDGDRFICNSSNKLSVYHITSCPSDTLCYFDKLNGLANSDEVNRTKLKSGIPDACIKTKCVSSSSGANCRNGASTSGTTVNRTLAYGTSVTASETTTSGWSYSTNYGCYISSSLLADNCSSGGGTAGDDVPSSGSNCHQYKRCYAAGCASTTKQCTKVGGFVYKGFYDSGGVCETKYNPSRCGKGTSCTNCQYDSCTYTCTSYRRSSVCGCEY